MGGCSKHLADWAYIKIVLGSNINSFRVAGMHFRVPGLGRRAPGSGVQVRVQVRVSAKRRASFDAARDELV